MTSGKAKWSSMIRKFFKEFEPMVEKTMNIRAEHKAGERELGLDPKTGRPVFVKIGRYGPIIQIGTADDEEKPLFAQLPAEKSMSDITLEDALELFKLPRTLGNFENKSVSVGTGRFGPFRMENEEKRQQEQKRHLKTFEEDPKLEVMNGRYGAYICYDGKNYRMPKAMQNKAGELTYEQCMQVVSTAENKKK